MATSPTELNGVALVTGAGSGVGRSAAVTLAARGVEWIFCTDLSNGAAATTAMIINNRMKGVAKPICLDVTDERSVVDGFKEALELQPTGRIDYVVNAAGSGPAELTSITDLSLEQYTRMDHVHNIGSFLVLREALRVMAAQEPRPMPMRGYASRTLETRNTSRGAIVMVASFAAKGGAQGAAGYVAAKHAVEGLVQTAALESARSGIRVNGVAPTYIEDGMMQLHLAKRPGLREELLRDLPLRRLVEPGEVSDAIVFLLSTASSYTNGMVMSIDGGASGMLGRPRYC